MKKVFAILMLLCNLAVAGEVVETFGAVSDYRFRGISQSNLQPSLANQFEYITDNELWIGNKLNTVSKQQYPGIGLESDVYGGWSHNWGDGFKTYAGDYEYTYAGATQFNTNEAFVQLRVPYFTFKYYRSLTNYFNAPNSVGTQYYSVDNYIPAQQITWVSHIGRTVVANNSGLNYTDMRVGPTTSIGGIDIALTYYWNRGVSTQFRVLNTTDGHALYQNAIVLSISKNI